MHLQMRDKMCRWLWGIVEDFFQHSNLYFKAAEWALTRTEFNVKIHYDVVVVDDDDDNGGGGGGTHDDDEQM